MLHEVRVALFAVAFVQRSGLDQHAHHPGAGGRRVVSDDVAHAVGEAPEAVVRIERDVAGLEGPGSVVAGGRVLPGCQRGRQEQEKRNQESSHRAQTCPSRAHITRARIAIATAIRALKGFIRALLEARGRLLAAQLAVLRQVEDFARAVVVL
ncbi:hypothetical protein SPHV1_40016 [Novosphingobium sp. KN65.2]|nr:hypothetical protein SPHV1_40016 [Novosphingobium sp. KN65.2]